MVALFEPVLHYLNQFLTVSPLVKQPKPQNFSPAAGQFFSHGYIILRNLSNIFIHGKTEGGFNINSTVIHLGSTEAFPHIQLLENASDPIFFISEPSYIYLRLSLNSNEPL